MGPTAERRLGVHADVGARRLRGHAGARAARGADRVAGGDAVVRRGAGKALRRLAAARAPLLLVAAGARSLPETRGGEAERDAAGDDRPRLAAPEVLEVAQDCVTVGMLEVIADGFGSLCRLLGELRRLVLALAAQLVGDAARVLGHRADPVAGLRRALVHLLADAVLRLARRLLSGLLGFLFCLLGRARPI